MSNNSTASGDVGVRYGDSVGTTRQATITFNFSGLLANDKVIYFGGWVVNAGSASSDGNRVTCTISASYILNGQKINLPVPTIDGGYYSSGKVKINFMKYIGRALCNTDVLVITLTTTVTKTNGEYCYSINYNSVISCICRGISL